MIPEQTIDEDTIDADVTVGIIDVSDLKKVGDSSGIINLGGPC